MRKNFGGILLVILLFVFVLPVWALDATPPDPLTPLLGKSFNDPALQKSLDQFGKWEKGEPGLFGFDCKSDRGLVFSFQYSQGNPVLDSFSVRKPYSGILPFGITFKDTRNKLNNKFGPPIDAQAGLDVWDFMNIRLRVNYEKDNTIAYLDLMRSYMLIKYPDITPVDPEKQKLFPADLQALIDKTIMFPVVVAFLKNLGRPEAVKQDQNILYNSPLNCITIKADQNKKITEIDISREVANGEYRYYPGMLPGGLIWDDNRVSVEKKLGKPSEMVVVIGAAPEAVYKFAGIELTLEYEPDPANMKNQVMRRISVQKLYSL